MNPEQFATLDTYDKIYQILFTLVLLFILFLVWLILDTIANVFKDCSEEAIGSAVDEYISESQTETGCRFCGTLCEECYRVEHPVAG